MMLFHCSVMQSSTNFVFTTASKRCSSNYCYMNKVIRQAPLVVVSKNISPCSFWNCCTQSNKDNRSNYNVIRRNHHLQKRMHCKIKEIQNSNNTYYSTTTSKTVSSTNDSSFSFRVAIVGSGPSGCYTAKYLQTSFHKKYNIQPKIDIFERLPVPYGLVRYGVAPDHPEVKNVQNDFNVLFNPTTMNTNDANSDDTTTSSSTNSNIQFYGNVHIGTNISIDELRTLYDIVILAYGCESDRKLGVEGENELHGILSAREFVSWYNGHPDYVHIGTQVANAFNLPPKSESDNFEISNNDTSSSNNRISKQENQTNNRSDDYNHVSVVIIGQGNVALDCARILTKGSSTGLYETDIASYTIPILQNGATNVSIVGRRGHVQGAYTIKELRELTKLELDGYDTSFVVRTEELQNGTTEATKTELSNPTNGKPKQRMDNLLWEAAKKDPNPALPKRIDLRFLLNPIQFVPSTTKPTTVGAVRCERTRLEGPPGQQIAVGTGIYETIPAQLVLISIGYKAMPIPGTEQWFDARRGTIQHVHGRVDIRGGEVSMEEEKKTENEPKSNQKLGGLYVSGWLKRGPSGIIGTNIMDAKDTVATIVKDIDDGILVTRQRSNDDNDENDEDTIASILRQRKVPYVNWEGVQRIQEYETNVHNKRSVNQPREKVTTIYEMIQIANPSSLQQ